VIRVPTPTELIVINDEQADVEIHLATGTCVATFAGLDAANLAKQYSDWVSNPDPEDEWKM
jgi:hypothetical protein